MIINRKCFLLLVLSTDVLNLIFLANFRVFIHKAQGKSAGNSHCKETCKNSSEFLNLEAYVEMHAMGDVL